MSKPNADQSAFELSYWETIKNSRNPADFRSYLERYPDGQFTELARRRGKVDDAAGVNGQGVNIESAPYVSDSGASYVDAPDNRQKQIATLLASARASFASGDLVQPAGTNATDRYRAVLRLQPRQAEALAGLERVAASLVVSAERALKSGDIATASQLASQARSVQPDYPRLQRLQSDINNTGVKLQRREQANLADSNEHLTKARIYLDRGATLHNVAEANDHYDDALAATPTAPDLKALRERISLAYVAAAQAELADNEPARAAKVVAYARKRKMSSSSLDELEPTIQQRLQRR